MAWIHRWRNLFRQHQLNAELDEELRFHIEARARDLAAGSGMSSPEAHAAARRAFGNTTLIQERTRDMDVLGWLDILGQELRYSVRSLRRSPGFTTVALLSLVLGIGANTAMFSVVHAVLLRPLPYPDPERLVRPLRQPSNSDSFTIPEFQFWREHSRTLNSLAGYRGAGTRSMADASGREWVRTVAVTTDFLRTLGTPPVRGREFTREETTPEGPQAMILTDSLWQSAFSSDPQMLGRSVEMDGAQFTIVGILPPGFWFPDKVDAFVPLQAGNGLVDTGTNTLLLGRLAGQISMAQAQSELSAEFENFHRAYPGKVSRDARSITLKTLQASLARNARLTLELLFGAAGLLLLIACANLAGLLLARFTTRQRELAVRLALGSSQQRLLLRFLIENLILALTGGVAGVLVAEWLLRALLALLPLQLPAAGAIEISLPVLGFALAASVLTGLLFSAAPLLASTRLNVNSTLKAGGRTGNVGRTRTRSVMVISEVALSMVLLAGAGLLIRSLYQLQQERLGFTPNGSIVLETPIDKDKHQSTADLVRHVEIIREALAALPRVDSVGSINVLPLSGFTNLPAQRDGHPEQSIGGMEYRLATPELFTSLVIPVLRGRTFTKSDTRDAPPVVVINETLARRWWLNGNPVGDRIVVGRYEQKEFPEVLEAAREVIGVVADTKSAWLKAPPQPTIYVPVAQVSDAIAQTTGNLTWVVHGTLSPALGQEIRQAIAQVAPHQRINRLRSLTEVVSSASADTRFEAVLLAAFAGLALLLTAVGLYGLLSFSVAQRRQEIGTRMALGATRRDVLMMIMRQAALLLGIGLSVGLIGAVSVLRLLASLLYGIRPSDPLSFAAVSILLLMVGLFASYIPARRATRVDPAVALRYE